MLWGHEVGVVDGECDGFSFKGPGMAWLTTNADALISARAQRATYIESQEWLKEAA